MGKPVSITWQSFVDDGICETQNAAGAGPLVINGIFSSGGIATFDSVSRTVSISSVNNLSARTFVVNGTLNGAFQTSTVFPGPNNDTVDTVELFDTVTSVTINGAGNAIQVGSGSEGRTHWVLCDYYRTVFNMGLQCVVTGTIDYSFIATMDNIETIGSDEPTVFVPVTQMDTETGDAFAQFQIPARYVAMQINSSDDDGSLVATFLQQGVT